MFGCVYEHVLYFKRLTTFFKILFLVVEICFAHKNFGVNLTLLFTDKFFFIAMD